jgi:uncharacterized damage-inducible protein DinB
MTSAPRGRPDATEYAPFYAGYIAAVPDGDAVTLLGDLGRELDVAVRRIPESRGGYRYAEGKWSIREMLGHVIDAERIFTYRALRIARGDATPLPGFDENAYVPMAGSDRRTIADLADELRAVRESSGRLFASLPDEAWSRRGNTSGKEITVRALAWITVGHAQHHRRMLHERYDVE